MRQKRGYKRSMDSNKNKKNGKANSDKNFNTKSQIFQVEASKTKKPKKKKIN